MATEDRLKRILAMVPWIVAHDGPSVAETCARFSCTPPELMRDIQLLYLCGLYPYTPDLLIEASVVEGRVYVEYADYFSRPLRLTPAEGLGLVAAASALLSTPGTDPQGPLARGLAKLAAALGGDEVTVDVDLGATDQRVVQLLRDAVAGETQVSIRYYSFGRNDVEDRIIEPASVFQSVGEWYVHAWCHRARDERTFRVDRVEHAQALSTPRTGPVLEPATTLFSRRAETGVVELALSPTAYWVRDRYPIEESFEAQDGWLHVRLAVAEWAWLDRLMLQLGDTAELVTAPPEWPGTQRAARQLLERYLAGPTDQRETS